MVANQVQLWQVQSDLLHRQLAHILLIRGWAASLSAGLIVAIVTSRQPLVATGALVLVAFWYMDHVYGRFLEVYIKRESALRHWLAQSVQNAQVAQALNVQATYRRGLPRTVSYLTMLGVVVATALYLGGLS